MASKSLCSWLISTCTGRATSVPSILMLCACSAYPDNLLETDAGVVREVAALHPSWEEYLSGAERLSSGEYLVEGDLVFSNEEGLHNYFDSLREGPDTKLAVFQRKNESESNGYEPTFVGTDALDIVYCVANNFPTKSLAVDDIAAATQAWQDVTNVRFRYDSGQDGTCDQHNTTVDFAFMNFVNPVDDEPLGCATNKLSWQLSPYHGCPNQVPGGPAARGTLLARYSSPLPFPAPWDAVSRQGLLRHELGHILGFRHEHPWAPNQGGCEELPDEPLETSGRRLTDYDQASVMHYIQCAGVPGVDVTISVLDGVGARSIYGMPTAWYVAVL